MSSNKMKTLTINGVQFTIVDETVGSLSDLNTTDKSSVVAAVNEVVSNAGSGSGGGSVTIDATLTQEGQAADAKAVGDKLNKLKDEISELNDVYVGADEPTDPNVQIWVNPDEDIPDVNYVKSVNGKTPDENGNVEIPVPDDSVDLTGYATEQFVQDGFQPKGDYLPSAELPNAVNDALVQAKDSGKFDGEKGEPGNSGVYIGSTKPVDPDINVWINPDEDLDDDTYVKSVNGITPDENGNVEIKIPESSGSSVTIDPTLTQSGQAADAKAVGDALAELEKKIPSIDGLATEEYVDEAIANIDIPTSAEEKYTLLNNIALTEAVNSIEINQADDGTPYNLKAIYVEVGCTTLEKEYGTYNYFDNNVSMSTTNAIHPGRKAHFKTSERYGMNQAESWYSVDYADYTRNEYKTNIPRSANTTPFQNITGIKLTTEGQAVTFTVKVWGVNAK